MSIENSQPVTEPARKRAPWQRKPIPRWFEPPAADDVLLRAEEVASWADIEPYGNKSDLRMIRPPAKRVPHRKPRMLGMVDQSMKTPGSSWLRAQF